MGFFNSLVTAVKNTIYRTPSQVETPVEPDEKPQISYVASVVNYAYNTVEHVFSQLGVLPKTIKDLWEYEPSAPIVNTILLTLYRDVFPLLAINAANDIMMGYADEKRDKEAPWMSLDTALMVSLSLIQMGVSFYTWHKAGKALINNSTANIFVASAFSGIKRNPAATVCKPKCNTGLVVLNNYINETATLYANVVAVYAIERRMPYVGWAVAAVFSIYSNGRYIARLTTPERCTKHKHLQPEYTLALGLVHKGLELAVFNMPIWLPGMLRWVNGMLIWTLPGMQGWTTGMQNFTMDMLNSKFGMLVSNISMPYLCVVLIRQSLFLFEVAVAAHLRPPLIAPKDRTFSLDPVELYEKFANDVMIWGYVGIKSIIDRMLNGPPSTINWAEIANKGIVLLQHPKTHAVQCFFLPPMLHSWENFINTPIISPHWDTTHSKIIKIIETFETYSRSNVVHVANKAPGKAAKLFQLLLGVPNPVAKAVLEVMSNERKMALINAMRVWLEDHSVKKLTNIKSDNPEVPLNNNPVNPFEENSTITPIKEVTHVNPEVASQLTERRKSGNHDFFNQVNKRQTTKRQMGVSPPLQLKSGLMGNK